MNRKLIALATAFLALAASNAFAITSYTITIGAGLNFIANELINPAGNAVATLLPSPPGPVTLSKWNTATGTFIQNSFDPDLGWSDPAMTLNPGEGAVLDNASGGSFPVTFTGAVPAALPALVMDPCQLYLVSRRVGGLGPSTYADIVGAPPMNGSTVFKFSPGAGGFTTATFLGGNWYTPAGALTPAPTVALGESVWVTRIPELGISVGGAPCAATDVKLTWAGPAVLQSAPALGGPWATVAGATSPFCDPPPPPGGIKFYRLICPGLPGGAGAGGGAPVPPSGAVVAAYTITLGAGINSIANELVNPAGNAVATLLPSPPGPVTLSKWNKSTGTYIQTPFDPEAGGWSNPAMTLNPGEGAVLDNASGGPFPVTFIGAVPAALPALVIGQCEFCLLSRRVGGVGPSTYADIVGAPPMNGSAVLEFGPGAGGFTTSTFLSSAWYTPAGALTPAPTVALGESVWITRRPELGISVGGAPCAATDVKLTWAGPAVLQSAPALGGPWATVAGATSPFCAPPGGIAFYRLICP